MHGYVVLHILLVYVTHSTVVFESFKSIVYTHVSLAYNQSVSCGCLNSHYCTTVSSARTTLGALEAPQSP
jgi:hypothetical protein